MTFDEVLAEQKSYVHWVNAASYGCYFCGRTVDEAVHTKNTAYVCRTCFERYKPEPMPQWGEKVDENIWRCWNE